MDESMNMKNQKNLLDKYQDISQESIIIPQIQPGQNSGAHKKKPMASVLPPKSKPMLGGDSDSDDDILANKNFVKKPPAVAPPIKQ